MRVMVLVHTVPAQLNQATPWHFFQELGALADQGVELCVASTVVPEFALPGVTFVDLTPRALRRSLRTMLSAWKLDRRVMREAPGWSALPLAHRLRVASWNARVVELARSWRPDVLHSHWAVPLGSGGLLASRALDVPYIMTLRGTDHLVNRDCAYGDCLDPLYERTLRIALQHAALITITCNDSLVRLRELGVSDDQRISRIEHSVDARRFAASAEESARFAAHHAAMPKGHKILCVAGMDHASKGHADLLLACKDILRERNGHLLLVGDGPLRPTLQAMARELGIAERVHFLGRLHPSDVQHVMRVADLSVLPSWTEAFGNVVFESLLVGTPVVTSRVGAPGEIVAREGVGEVYAAHDVQGLRDSIARVLDSMSEARKKAAQGAAFVREHLSVERRARAFARAYEWARAHHGARG